MVTVAHLMQQSASARIVEVGWAESYGAMRRVVALAGRQSGGPGLAARRQTATDVSKLFVFDLALN